LQNSTSEEFNKDAENKIVHFVDGQENAIKKGGNMRLGTYNCKLTKNTLAYSLYGKEVISEKHRHRYELNEKYVSLLEQNEFIVSGRNPKSNLVEIMELKNHPFFLGVQFHGEFKSRFNWDGNLGHPVFIGFVSKVIENKKLNDK
jgi:CTP synthase